MTNSRTHRTQGKPRARERIAAERAARKRAEARRRLLLAIGAVTAVVAIVATLVTLKLTAAPGAPDRQRVRRPRRRHPAGDDRAGRSAGPGQPRSGGHRAAAGPGRGARR